MSGLLTGGAAQENRIIMIRNALRRRCPEGAAAAERLDGCFKV